MEQVAPSRSTRLRPRDDQADPPGDRCRGCRELVQPFQFGMHSVACATMIGWPSPSARRTRPPPDQLQVFCADTSQRLTCRDDVLSIGCLIYN